MSKIHCIRPAIYAVFGLGMASAQAANIALEEVVVTAQKRFESAQDTPISMAAFSSAALERQGITGMADLKDKIPNFQLTPHPNSATTARVFMRGIGNNDDQITQDPSVAMYVDGVYVARSQGLAMEIADIERIEVLRGPQGSLYGRNATGGAINFYSKAPIIGQWGFRQDFSFGNRNLFRSRTSVNAPLADTAAVELTYLKEEKDGFVKNAGTGVSRFGDTDRQAWRAALLWQPRSDLEVRYTYDYSRIEDTPAYIQAVPLHQQAARPFERTKRASRGSSAVRNLPANDVKARGHNLTVSWDINDNLSLKSITGYRELDNYNYQDYHTGVYGAFPIFTTEWDQSQDQFTQEFQLVGDAFDGRVEYVAGIYYFEESADSDDFTVTPPQNSNSVRSVEIDNTARALFGQATWTPPILDDRLHVTLGMRWSADRRKASLKEVTYETPDGRNVILSEGAGSGRKTFTDTSPSLIVAYDLTYDVNVYAKVVTGYKTGGFNIRATSMANFERGYDQEELVSYEAGLKSQFLDNRLRINAAVFRADYDDIQLNMQTDPNRANLTDVLNAGEAVINGAELDITALLMPGLTATVSYGYLSTDYKKIKDPVTGLDISSGFYFVEVPRHSYNLDLEYMFPSLPFGELTANLGYSWQGERIASSTDKRYVIDDYGLLNARLSLSNVAMGGGELRLALWGRNLEDKQYYASHFNAGTAGAFFGEPRSYGIDVTYEY